MIRIILSILTVLIFVGSISAQEQKLVKRIYLLDVSKSMVGEKEKRGKNCITRSVFDYLKKELTTIISGECSVCEDDEIVIIPFTDKPLAKIRGFGYDYEYISAAINQLTTISGRTDIDAAWMAGLEEFNPNRTNILYLLTDGINNSKSNTNTLYKHIENWKDDGSNFAFFFKILSNDVSNQIQFIASKKETMVAVDYSNLDMVFFRMKPLYKIDLTRRKEWVSLPTNREMCCHSFYRMSEVKLSLEDETNYTIESYVIDGSGINIRLVSKCPVPVSENNKLIVKWESENFFCYPNQIDIQIDANIIDIKFAGYTPLDKACDYVSKRTTYTEEVDSVYIYDEVPKLEKLSYEDIFQVVKTLEGTPAFDYAVLFYLKARNNILDNVQYKFNKYVNNIEVNFDTLVIPMILQEVNDYLTDDLEKILEIYTGWGGIKIVHSAEEMISAWHKVIYKGKYNNIINKLIKDYDDEVLKFYRDYSLYSDIPSEGSYKANDFKIITPSDVITKYTEQQNSSTIKDVVINGGFLVLDFATGGASTWLHALVLVADAGQTVYDIYTTYSADATEEDKLIIGIVQAIDMQIVEYLRRSYHQHIRKQNQKMMSDIFSTLKKNEHEINFTYNWEPIEELEFYYNK